VPGQLNPARPGERSSHGFNVLGRLISGVTLEQARAELTAWVAQSQANTSAGTHGFHSEGHTIVSFRLHDEVVGGLKPALTMLLGAVGFVL
jgi:hypothetical protein